MKVLYLVHRISLVKQTMKRFQKHFGKSIRVRMIGGGEKRVPKSGVLVATTQTASLLLESFEFRKFLGTCDILFIDEFHINKASSISHITKQCGAPMRFGLSGTIDTEDEKKMLHYMGMTGPIIASVRNKELVEKGRSAKPYIRMIEVEDNRIPARSFRAQYLLGIVRNKVRNRLVVREAIRYVDKGYKTMILVSRIAHGYRILHRLERKVEIPIEFIHGSTPMHLREDAIKRFSRGKLPILIGSNIFDVGMDLPDIEAIVYAGGGVGWELIIQRLGRALRKKSGSNKVRISDFVDAHGSYIFRHSMARVDHYRREEIAVIKFIGGD